MHKVQRMGVSNPYFMGITLSLSYFLVYFWRYTIFVLSQELLEREVRAAPIWCLLYSEYPVLYTLPVLDTLLDTPSVLYRTRYTLLSSAPFLYSGIPVFPYSCIPVFLYSFIPLFLYSCIPVFLYSCIPLFLFPFISFFIYSFFPFFLYSCILFLFFFFSFISFFSYMFSFSFSFSSSLVHITLHYR